MCVYIYISLHGLLHFRHFSYLSINTMEDSFFAHVTRSCKPVQRQIFVPSHPDCLLWLNDWNWGWGTAVNAICLDIKEAYNTVFLCTPSWGAIQRDQARPGQRDGPSRTSWTWVNKKQAQFLGGKSPMQSSRPWWQLGQQRPRPHDKGCTRRSKEVIPSLNIH